MEWQIVLALLVCGVLLLFLTGLPVAFCFLLVDLVGLYLLIGPAGLTLLVPSAFDSIASFILVPVPLFIFMGELLLRSGLATLAIDTVDVWLGRLPGRLALVTVGSGALFGALSGSSMASTAMLGSTLIPEMDRRGYKPNMSLAAVLAAGGLDVLIPPSALGVLLAALANVSVAKLLVAGILPGLLLAVLYALYFGGRAALQPHLAPPHAATPLAPGRRLATLLRFLPLVVLMVLVTGSILIGLATPTEAAALGATGTMAVAAAARRLTRSVLWESALAAVRTTSMVFIILVGSKAFSQLLAASGASRELVTQATQLDVSPLVLLVLLQAVVFVLGCFVDQISIMLLTIPIFMPVANAMGWDPLWFSLLLLVNLQLAGITPPFGLQLFVLKGIQPARPMTQIYAAALPIVLIQVLFMGVLIAFPEIALALPRLMDGT